MDGPVNRKLSTILNVRRDLSRAGVESTIVSQIHLRPSSTLFIPTGLTEFDDVPLFKIEEF